MISMTPTQLTYNNESIAYHTNHEIRNVQIFLACSLPVYLYRQEKDNLQRKNAKKDGSHSIRVYSIIGFGRIALGCRLRCLLGIFDKL